MIATLISMIDEVGGKVHNPYFRSAVADGFMAGLRETQDINVRFRGWTILHYCAYTASYGHDNRVHAIMKYVLQNGGDVNAGDDDGRTFFYFFETPARGAKIYLNPPNERVKPLHVIVNLLWKSVRKMIQSGADPNALDYYGRTPLHCALIVNTYTPDNVPALLEHAPLSTEHADIFGNYPLYYALLYRETEVINKVAIRTATAIINHVLSKIAYELSTTRDFAPHDACNDPIYHVDDVFHPAVGGAPKRKKAEAKKGDLEKVKKESEYQGYPIWADAHGIKHTKNSYRISKTKLDPKQKRKFDAATVSKGCPATFYPEVADFYDQLLTTVFRAWVDSGADFANPIVEMNYDVGADQGTCTNHVLLYYCDVTGSHIRPINPNLFIRNEHTNVRTYLQQRLLNQTVLTNIVISYIR